MGRRPERFTKKLFLACTFALALTLAGCADYKTGQLAYKDRNYPVARQHFKELAEFGLPEAQTQYASMLLKGEGEPADPVRARYYLEQAVNQDYLRAYPALAKVYLNGQGGPAYTYRARGLLEAAVQQGNTRVLPDLAKLYENGIGGPRDPQRARELYAQALAQGDPDAAYHLGQIAEEQNRLTDAQTLYLQSVNAGNFKAAKQMGSLYEKTIQPPEPTRALAWYYYAQKHGIHGLEKRIAKLESKISAEDKLYAQRISQGLHD